MSAILCKDNITYISQIADNRTRNSKFVYGKIVTNAKKVIRCGLVTWEGMRMKRGKVGEKGSKSCYQGCSGSLQAVVPDHCSLGHDNKLAVSIVPTPFFHNQEGPGVSEGTLVEP